MIFAHNPQLARQPAPSARAVFFAAAVVAVIITSLEISTTPAIALQLTEQQTDELVKDALKQWDVPGASLVVVDRNRVMYLKGHGVRELGKTAPVTADTFFPIASCTKAFTATLIGMLVDEGKIGWDDPVRKHLPEFRLSDPLANEGVTLRDLLCHRTGLGGHDELWYRSPWPVTEQIRRAGLLPSSHMFRTTFHYQSVMYSAAGLATARAAASSWEELVHERIFRPLGMQTAQCTSRGNNRAQPHQLNPERRLTVTPWYEQLEPNAAGSVHLSARDLGFWLMFQLGDGAWQGKRLITTKSLLETHTPQIVQKMEGIIAATHPRTQLMSYGLGWVIQDYRGTLVWSHTGLIDGFRAQLLLAPQSGYAIGVLSNRHETRMNLALAYSVLDHLTGVPAGHDWNQHLLNVVARDAEIDNDARLQRDQVRQRSVPPRNLSKYCGVYTHAALGDCEITRAENSLAWSWNTHQANLVWDTEQKFHVAWPALREPEVQFQVVNDEAVGLQLFGVTFAKKP